MNIKKSKKTLCILIALTAGILIAPRPASATWLNNPDNPYQFRAGFETGFLGVLSHRIQLGSNGTVFDYVKDGGQANLLFFNRLTAEMHLGPRHGLVFLYQPLDVRTEDLLSEDLVVDSLLFPAETPMEFRYGFDFYRLSYLFDFNKDPQNELAAGISLQIRNATISFASKDGTLFRTTQNIGPVPIFKFRWAQHFKNGAWLGAEADGFYADGRYITGSANDFMGAIFDVSGRYGFRLNESLDGFVNLRYLGGGARGTDETPADRGDGFTDNWLNTMTLTLGFYMQ